MHYWNPLIVSAQPKCFQYGLYAPDRKQVQIKLKRNSHKVGVS